jgi:hypothetical protein
MQPSAPFLIITIPAATCAIPARYQGCVCPPTVCFPPSLRFNIIPFFNTCCRACSHSRQLEPSLSTTILSKTPNSLQMYPQHAQQRARVDRWMHWYHTGSRNATTKLLIPFLSGKSADILAAGREEVGRHVQVICTYVQRWPPEANDM